MNARYLCSYDSSYQSNYEPIYDVQFVFYDEDEYDFEDDDEMWDVTDYVPLLPSSGQFYQRCHSRNLKSTSNHHH